MDRAGTDNDEEPFPILPVENPADGFTRVDYQGGSLIGDRQLRLDGARRRQRVDF